MTARPPDSDRDLVRRSARRITIQTAAIFFVGVALLVVATATVSIHNQDADANRRLHQAIVDTDAVTDPPSGVVVYEASPARARASVGLHDAPIDAAAVSTVRDGGPAETGLARFDGRDYLLRTERRGDTTVQAALDLSDQKRERRTLIEVLAITAAAGVLLALGAGRFVARRAIAPLGDALERQARFVADASHELRTPLTRVHTRAQIIQRALRSADGRDITADADRLVDGTRELTEIVNELLLSAQLRSDPQYRDPVDLGALSAEVVDADRQRADEQGVRIALYADGGPYVVPGSATALRRVIGALIDNAIGHTPRGGDVAVTVESGSDRTTVVCTVRDTGVGFDNTKREAIFARFARGSHGSGRRYGLGLALAREVITAHRGTITAQGRPGAGATFTVALPAWR